MAEYQNQILLLFAYREDLYKIFPVRAFYLKKNENILDAEKRKWYIYYDRYSTTGVTMIDDASADVG